MRVIGRYFAIGATLGSVSGLIVLVLIWIWMTVHLGLLGFLVGWVPAGLAAAALWLTMVLFWAPILIVGAMISAMLLALRPHHGRDWPAHEPPPISEPDERPIDAAPSPEVGPTAPLGAEDQAPPAAAQPSLEPPAGQTATDAPPTSPAAPIAPALAPNARPSEDLGGDAAAAGDTSRKPRR